MNFFLLQCYCEEVPQSPISTSAPLFSVTPVFLEEHFNSQVRISKIINEHIMNYQPKPSGLTPRLHPIYISLNSLGFSLPPDCFILQTRISHHGCETFSNL